MENLNNAYIQQFTKKYDNDHILLYTFIDDGENFELWLGIKGYGKMTFLYGGPSENSHEFPLNLDYAVDSETIKELTGEDLS